MITLQERKTIGKVPDYDNLISYKLREISNFISTLKNVEYVNLSDISENLNITYILSEYLYTVAVEIKNIVERVLKNFCKEHVLILKCANRWSRLTDGCWLIEYSNGNIITKEMVVLLKQSIDICLKKLYGNNIVKYYRLSHGLTDENGKTYFKIKMKINEFDHLTETSQFNLISSSCNQLINKFNNFFKKSHNGLVGEFYTIEVVEPFGQLVKDDYRYISTCKMLFHVHVYDDKQGNAVYQHHEVDIKLIFNENVGPEYLAFEAYSATKDGLDDYCDCYISLLSFLHVVANQI